MMRDFIDINEIPEYISIWDKKHMNVPVSGVRIATETKTMGTPPLFDPRGFNVSISLDSLLLLIGCTSIVNGVIDDEIWYGVNNNGEYVPITKKMKVRIMVTKLMAGKKYYYCAPNFSFKSPEFDGEYIYLGKSKINIFHAHYNRSRDIHLFIDLKTMEIVYMKLIGDIFPRHIFYEIPQESDYSELVEKGKRRLVGSIFEGDNAVRLELKQLENSESPETPYTYDINMTDDDKEISIVKSSFISGSFKIKTATFRISDGYLIVSDTLEKTTTGINTFLRLMKSYTKDFKNCKWIKSEKSMRLEDMVMCVYKDDSAYPITEILDNTVWGNDGATGIIARNITLKLEDR